MVAVLLGSCDSQMSDCATGGSPENLQHDYALGSGEIEDPIYLSFSIPVEKPLSRASQAGDEYAYCNETKVNSVEVLLFTPKDNNYITGGYDMVTAPFARKYVTDGITVLSYQSGTTDYENVYQFTVAFSYSLIRNTMRAAYDEGYTNNPLYAWFRVNQSPLTETELENYKHNRVYELSDYHTPWIDSNFYMCAPMNQLIPIGTLGTANVKTDAAWSYYRQLLSDPSNTVTVKNTDSYPQERQCARIDYKQGGENADNVYEIGGDENLGNDMVNCRVVEMALINLNSKWYENYYVRPEYSYNYTLTTNYDPYTNLKDKWVDSSTTDLSYTFMYPYQDSSTWEWTDVDDLTTEDSDVGGWQTGDYFSTGYKIWRYVTENKITNNDNQRHGISTGICFKAKLLPISGNTEITTAMANKEKLYVYDYKMYGTWSMIQGIINTGNTDLMYAYQNSYDADGNYSDAQAVKAGFTIYSPDDDGNYYNYYYYWIRTNDNNKIFTMGDLEFSVSRNYVYKLSIGNITKFGHPTLPDDERIPDRDPDPDRETHPDEDSYFYLNMATYSVPWIVEEIGLEY